MARRSELRARYEERLAEPAVYLLRSTVTGRILVASTPDLASLRNRLAFGSASNSPGVLDRRLLEAARRDGVASFELEVLDTLEVKPGMTAEQIAADLAALEALWREELADSPQF